MAMPEKKYFVSFCKKYSDTNGVCLSVCEFYFLLYLQYASPVTSKSLRHQIIRNSNNMSFE